MYFSGRSTEQIELVAASTFMCTERSRGEEAPCTCQLSEASDGSSNRRCESTFDLFTVNTEQKRCSESHE